jgi:hypothetical protein
MASSSEERRDQDEANRFETMMDMIREFRNGNRARQATLRLASERLMTAAARAAAAPPPPPPPPPAAGSSSNESLAFNKEAAGAINNIIDITNSMIADMDTFFITALASNEKITMLGELVATLPQVAENPKVASRIIEKMGEV